jgi:hypothetical protein
MARRRKAEPKPKRRPVTPSELRDLAEAQLLTSRALVNAAKARAIDAATERGDRTGSSALSRMPAGRWRRRRRRTRDGRGSSRRLGTLRP